MKLDVHGYKLGLALRRIIKTEVETAGRGLALGKPTSLRFFDPAYAIHHTEARPVEIVVGHDGVVQRITEFWLFGVNGTCKLTKMMEFNFVKRRFICFGVPRRLHVGLRAFWRWRRDFQERHKAGVYKIEISEV